MYGFHEGYCDLCGDRSTHLRSPTKGEVEGLCSKCHKEYVETLDSCAALIKPSWEE